MPRKQASEKEIVVTPSVPARRKPAIARGKRIVKPVIVAPENQPMQETPSREEIAMLAYSYWQARGCQGGSPEADWLHAEQELATKQRQRAAAAIA